MSIFYIIICAKIIPQTHGRPKTPLPATVHQLSGTNTPVRLRVKLIIAIATNPKTAFKNTDFISR